MMATQSAIPLIGASVPPPPSRLPDPGLAGEYEPGRPHDVTERLTWTDANGPDRFVSRCLTTRLTTRAPRKAGWFTRVEALAERSRMVGHETVPVIRGGLQYGNQSCAPSSHVTA
jgi:hypothetical protein